MNIESIGLQKFPDSAYGIILEYAHKDGDLYLHHDDGRIIKWLGVSTRTVNALLAAKDPLYFLGIRFEHRPYEVVRPGFRFPRVDLSQSQEDSRR